MKVSTRVDYGMRLMFQLALRHGAGYVFLRDIARTEGMPVKYLTQIVIPLRTRGLVVSSRGARGGYMLANPPAVVNARQIVEALDDSLVARAGRPGGARRRRRPGDVTSLVWNALGTAVRERLEAITLEQLVDAYRAAHGRALEYQI